ncbi:MAG: hypothetical protein QME58_09035 [Bacteroidota bacterium]|nr:hypothetical protein [Bacteroidota bacterium]
MKYIFTLHILNNIYFSKEMFIAHLTYFNLSGLIAFLSSNISVQKDKKSHLVVLISTLFIFYLEYGLISPVFRVPQSKQYFNSKIIQYYQNSINDKNRSKDGCNKMIVYFNLSDFNCNACIENILLFNSIVSSESNIVSENIIGFVGPFQDTDSLWELRINQWKDSFKIKFPLFPYFTDDFTSKSNVSVVNSAGKILYYDQFPIDLTRQENIINIWLKENENN